MFASNRKSVTTRANRANTSRRKPLLEPLEQRTMMALIGLAPDVPAISYNQTGQIHYNAAAGTFDQTATALAYVDTSFNVANIDSGGVAIHFKLDNSGALVSGVPGDDLVVTGNVDVDGDTVYDYTGTLLTGEITAFGYNDVGTTDQYDMRFTITGGALASQFTGKDLGVLVDSENSSFTGSFALDFAGGAKGTMGAVDQVNTGPTPVRLSGTKFSDTTGNGPSADDTPLGGTTINLYKDVDGDGHLTAADGAPIASTVTQAGTGNYSFDNIPPGKYIVAEVVPGGYAQTGPVTQLYAITVTSGVDVPGLNFTNVKLGSISGTKYRDLTGNGLSNDDTGLSGTTIKLFKDVDNNGQLTAADGAAVASMVTGAGGAFAFNDLQPGAYFVQEVAPSGYVRTTPALSDKYLVTVGVGSVITGKNFANFEKDDCAVTCVKYYIDNCGPYSTINGKTKEGSVVKVVFTIPAGHTDTLTLVSYKAPSPTFIASEASQQTIYDIATGTFGPGTYSLSVNVPDCYYQIDFVCGSAIDKLGPEGSNIFYSAQGRLLDHDNSGTNSDIDGLSKNAAYWAGTAGQTLIKGLNGGATSKLLATWMASNFPRLFGAQAGSYNLTGKTNTDVANNIKTLYAAGSTRLASAQAMATAISMWVSNIAQGGNTQAIRDAGFRPTTSGLAAGVFNVQNDGAAFDESNYSTHTVLELMKDSNANASSGLLFASDSVSRASASDVLQGICDFGDVDVV